ncbi:hypothetical protein N4G40_09665 [Pantoea eucrina]|uniref:Uncharacterized protein n=1 Tax=Pantoea eucrina TaxID=472693 RepID=A0ABU5LF01_9GAMM|nr:hypothetical protein [Pantoea eucrina]MDZ7278538.1 hypothetical protein [Pantoea eucrina]
MYAVSVLTRSLALMVLLPLPFAQAADTPELTGVSTNPLSITRIHDRVNFMVSLNFNNGKTAQQWRSVDCKQGKAQLLEIMKIFTSSTLVLALRRAQSVLNQFKGVCCL